MNKLNIIILSIPDEGYSRNESCTLNLISTFVLSQSTLPYQRKISNNLSGVHVTRSLVLCVMICR
jgi:hypothetical protein